MVAERIRGLALFVPFLLANADHWITMPDAYGKRRQYTVWQAIKLVCTMWCVAYWDPMPDGWDDEVRP